MDPTKDTTQEDLHLLRVTVERLQRENERFRETILSNRAVLDAWKDAFSILAEGGRK